MLFFSLVNFASAQIEITEIMYDLEGSDSRREWIEIYNSGSSDITLSDDWRFNDGKNHTFKDPPENGGQGSLTISPSAYVIIASDAATFIADNSDFSGTVIDTVMSLNNTADTLQIKDANGVVVSEVSYNNTMGASEDGNSLQKINGAWVSATPTPGTENSTGNNLQSQQQQNSGNSQEQTAGAGVWIKDNNKIYADAGEDKTVIVGADTLFKGKAFGFKNEPLEKARYLWNFGDGTIKEGNNIFHNFRYPGEYVVFLDVSSGAYSSSDRILVNALPSNLSISSVNFDDNSYIELYNDSKREIDISLWQLRSGDNYFIIPQNTYILPNRKNIFGKRATGLQARRNTEISLLYPNGEIAYLFTNTPVIKTVPLIPVSQKIVKKNIGVKPKNKKIKIITNITKQKVTDKKDYKQIQNTTLGAAVNMADNNKNNTSLYKWLTALIGLVFLSIGGLLFIRSKEIPSSNTNISDEIEIIE